MHRIRIEDDFDLGKIADCGQCFRAAKLEGPEDIWRFITKNSVLYIKHVGVNEYDVSCRPAEWKKIWSHYFDLDRDYSAIRAREKGRHPFIDSAMECGKGIRILRQDIWEMLVTFIISQRKSIPAIRKAVETLAEKYGEPLQGKDETVYAFPTPEKLASVPMEELKACGLGYRAPYVYDASQKVASGELKLDMMEREYEDIVFDQLKEVHGVGKKVANCVMLFGCGMVSRAPVDVWIAKAIEEEFDGKNIFDEIESDAGIIQQYIFYYERYGGNKE